MMRTYSRRKPDHKRLPLPPMLGKQFTPIDVEIGVWDYGADVRLRFFMFSQTWKARHKHTGQPLGEYQRSVTVNELIAALDAAIEESER